MVTNKINRENFENYKYIYYQATHITPVGQ